MITPMNTYAFPTTTDVATSVTKIAVDLKNRCYSALISPIIASICEYRQYRRADIGFLFEQRIIPYHSLLAGLTAKSYYYFRLGVICAVDCSYSRHVVGDSAIVALLLITDYEGFHLLNWQMLKDLSFIVNDDLLGQILSLSERDYNVLQETARRAVIEA